MDDKYLGGAKVFKALGDPKRVMIIDMLSCGELCACKILEKFEMSQSTLSHHMKLLCECGIIKGRDEGKWTYYSLDDEAIDRIKQFLNSITTKSDNCMSRESSTLCECTETETSKSVQNDFGGIK